VNARLELYDITGMMVRSLELVSGSSLLSIDTGDLPNGKYFYNIFSNDHILESNTIVVGH
jgi:hypothetical protein